MTNKAAHRVPMRATPASRAFGAGRLCAVAIITVGVGLSLGAQSAFAQACEQSQGQLSQAIVDSQSALDQIEGALNNFQNDLIQPRTGPIDNSQIVQVRDATDEYIVALNDFSSQITGISEACGSAFATDVATLNATIERYRTQRTRAEQLLADHQLLVDSGEPPMTQAQMEAVQRALINLGFYDGAIDGRFGSSTRASIRAYQSSRSLAATGYLTPPQFQELLDTPEADQEVDTPVADVPNLPSAPTADGDPPPPAPALSDEAREVCVANVNQVTTATERTQDYRAEVNPRVSELRTILRGPRVPAYDEEEAGRIAENIARYLDQIDDFYDQASNVGTVCGDEYETALASLNNQIDALRSVQQRAEQIDRDFATLIASGEPSMSREEMVQIQQALQARGHYSGALDALFGPNTRNAIRAYQAAVGAEQTGYLTARQVADLRSEAVAPPPDDEPSVQVLESPDDPMARLISTAVVRAQLEQDLADQPSMQPFSEIGRDEGAFGAFWWRMHDALATNGDAKYVIDNRYALMGAVYMERSAESLEMVDTHLLIADAYARAGLFSDAAIHLERAYQMWPALSRNAPAEMAAIQARLASVRLAQAAAGDAFDEGAFDAIATMLAEARASAEASVGANDALTLSIVDRLADLHAAANREATDAAVAAAVQARYPQ